MWLAILFFIVVTTKDCSHYDDGPIYLALNQISGTIQMLDTLEISFDLKIHTECIGWCHIFALGGRYPLLYTHSSAFYSEFLQYPAPYQNGGHVDSIADIYTSMIDGSYHAFRLKYTATERTIIFDDIVYINRNDVQNNIIHHHIFDISTVWGSNVQYATNASIKHLCINTKYNSISTTSQSTETTENTYEMSDVYDKEYDIMLSILGITILGIVCCVFYMLSKWMMQNKGNGDAENEERVKEWLVMIGLQRYFDAFIRNGFTSLEFISKIRNEKDLENIGVNLKGHQIVIMTEIENLKRLNQENDDAEGMSYGTNVEGNAVTESNI